MSKNPQALIAHQHDKPLWSVIELIQRELERDDFAGYSVASHHAFKLAQRCSLEMAGRYDPADKQGFSQLITYFALLSDDQRGAARMLGVAPSTLYRWKHGESVPHALVRTAVANTVKRILTEAEAAAAAAQDDPDSSRRRRSTTH